MGVNISVKKRVSMSEKVKEIMSHHLDPDYELPTDEELSEDLGEVYCTDACGYGHFIIMKNKFTHFISDGKYESLFDYCSVHRCRNLDSAKCMEFFSHKCPYEGSERDKSLSDYEWLIFMPDSSGARGYKVDYEKIEPCLPKLREFFKKRRILAYGTSGTDLGKQFLHACEEAVKNKGWIEVC